MTLHAFPDPGMNHLHAHQASAHFGRWGHLAVAAVLVLAFVTGGGAADYGLGDALTQWLALPLLAWAALAVTALPASRVRRAAVAAALLVAGTVAVQQLPLPGGLWGSTAVRNALGSDLHAAGVSATRHLWSLSPLASESGLWSLLPAVAVFLGTLAVPERRQRGLLLLVVALSAASLLLGYLQLGAPQDSLLNPFPQWAPALNGLFANPNHQATALALSLLAIAALLLEDRGREAPFLPGWVRFGLAALGLLLLASLPLTGSRAALLLAVLGLVCVPLLVGGGRRRATSATRTWTTRVVLGVLAVGTVSAAIGWLRYDRAEQVRWSVAQSTLAMGTAHAPWGAGVGSFVAWFDQATPASLMQRSYFNHAHNEYAQWWLESGVVGMAALLVVLAVLLACFPRRTRVGDDNGVAVAAWVGCVLLLLHSLVDYPLRTPALMTVAGLLAGIAVARRAAGGHQATPQ